MIWLSSNWRWSAFNLSTLLILIHVLSQGGTGWNNITAFDSGLESGKWAIRFLLACLTMTPLNTYFGWKGAIKLRKSAGLWAFGFACAHVLLFIRETKLDWLAISMPLYLALGLVGMSILSVLASTSNRWSMQRMGKNWKRLHRLVYLAGIIVLTHSMLAATMSKKLLVRDPEAVNELKVYAAILSLLLIVRIPVVRQLLKQIPTLLKRHHKPNLQVGNVVMPDGGTGLWPGIHGRESGASIKPTLLIPNDCLNVPEWINFGYPPKNLESYQASLSVETPPEREIEVQ